MIIRYEQSEDKYIIAKDIDSIEYKHNLAKGEEAALIINGAASIPISKITNISVDTEPGEPSEITSLDGFEVTISRVPDSRVVYAFTNIPTNIDLEYSWGEALPVEEGLPPEVSYFANTTVPVYTVPDDVTSLYLMITSTDVEGQINNIDNLFSIEPDEPSELEGIVELIDVQNVLVAIIKKINKYATVQYQWQQSKDDYFWTDDVYSTSETTGTTLNKCYRVIVTVDNEPGSIISNTVYTGARIEGSVAIVGTSKVGTNLTLAETNLPNTELLYSWYLINDSSGEEILITDNTSTDPSILTVTEDYVGFKIRVIVTAELYAGSASAVTETIVTND